LSRGRPDSWKAAGAIAAGLKLRLDWGTQYTSHVFERETRWLGIELSQTFVAELSATA
jgi:transposase InsO family protein